MTVITQPQDFNVDSLFVDLRNTLHLPLCIKVEGLNLAGSIKIKAATEMIERAEREGWLTPDSIVVESSSGNLGVALSIIAAYKGYPFLCVIDPRCNASTRLLIEAYGGHIHMVTEPDPEHGFLGARLNYIHALTADDSRYLWLNQYANPANWQAHYRRTGPEIARNFPNLDVLFVGAGTTGTLMGCARYFTAHHPHVRIVAVDSVGSVTFGGPPGPRMLPGLGAGIRPAQLDETLVDDVVMVDECDTVRVCHQLARRGFLFGGSTGTVIAGASQWLADHDAHHLTSVAIAPDLGERYLDTLYDCVWLGDVYGSGVLHEPRHLLADSALA